MSAKPAARTPGLIQALEDRLKYWHDINWDGLSDIDRKLMLDALFSLKGNTRTPIFDTEMVKVPLAKRAPVTVDELLRIMQQRDAHRALIAELTKALHKIETIALSAGGHGILPNRILTEARAALAAAEQHNNDGLTTKGE